MMDDNIPEFYFTSDKEWYAWLLKNHDQYARVYLIFYKVSSKKPSMRWEEAVKVALCFGWIDATVKKIDDEKRRQYFCPRKPKSVWSKVNKTYLIALEKEKKIQPSGYAAISIAKKNGSWTTLDDVDNLVIPSDLQKEFNRNTVAFENYKNFAPSYRKSYLYWLKQAKRETTRAKRIVEIIRLCQQNIKSSGW